MNEWELTDEELNTAVTSGAAQYKHERDTAIAWGDEEYYEHCAIARAAQKKLVEWLERETAPHDPNHYWMGARRILRDETLAALREAAGEGK